MTKISTATTGQVLALVDDVADRIRQCPALEDAAQVLTDRIHDTFRASCVLTRVFVTVPYGALPASSADWVHNLAQAKGVAGSLTPATQVLSLVASSGARPEWNGRRRSRGHVGIPLVSASFIDQIPMMARLLGALGRDLGWIDQKDSEGLIHTLGRLGGVFYVPDAATSVDARGRKIIADQAFVSSHGVKTVIGAGSGGAVPTGALMTLLFFASEPVPEPMAQAVWTALSRFRSQTMSMTAAGKIFAGT
jgi:GAF domain-containing protein